MANQFEAESAAPLITLATAHPAKFPDAVLSMSGQDAPLPAHVADLFERYFAGREDGFRPGVPGRLVTAEIPRED